LGTSTLVSTANPSTSAPQPFENPIKKTDDFDKFGNFNLSNLNV
jgi:hypothetical protein